MLHGMDHALRRYKNPDGTRRDINKTIESFKGLTWKVEPFVFNSGASLDLINLQGTIPVTYKGAVYNIPICIWLMDTHPNVPPICYVKPTLDMQIKVSMYVDHSGKIYLPYLHDWNWVYQFKIYFPMAQLQTPAYNTRSKSVGSNILEKGDVPLSEAETIIGPVGHSTHIHEESFTESEDSDMSPNTHLTSVIQDIDDRKQNGDHEQSSDVLGLITVMICAFGEYPPVFAKPRSDNTPYPTPGYMPMPTAYPSFSQSPTPYPPTPYPNTPYPNPMPAMRPPPPTPTQHFNYQPSPQPTVTTGSSGGTITDAHIRDSLLTALEHKIKQRLKENLGQSNAELDILQHTARELTQGKEKLDNIVEKLKKEKAELERTISILKEKDIELDKAITEIGEQGEVDVDEAVTTTAPLYKQILNTYAEEAALEDAIYYIGEALRRDVIDLEVFLKQIRTLSRKQFMLRALMQKCRQKAGLAC